MPKAHRKPPKISELLNQFEEVRSLRNFIALLVDLTKEQKEKRLLELLDNDDKRIRYNAVFVLNLLRATRATEALIRKLQDDPEPLIRGEAALALGRMENPEVVCHLARALSTDQDSEVRSLAAAALGSLKQTAVIQPLLTALQSESDEEVRAMIANSLGSLKAQEAVPLLKAKLAQTASLSDKYAYSCALAKIDETQPVITLGSLLEEHC